MAAAWMQLTRKSKRVSPRYAPREWLVLAALGATVQLSRSCYYQFSLVSGQMEAHSQRSVGSTIYSISFMVSFSTSCLKHPKTYGRVDSAERGWTEDARSVATTQERVTVKGFCSSPAG